MNSGISDMITILYFSCISNVNTSVTSAAVTIKDLITELHDVISWFQLGIYLDISPSELMKIRADHREKTDDCKTEMLVTWLRQATNASCMVCSSQGSGRDKNGSPCSESSSEVW